jgi:hypothetical protein
MKKLCFYVVCAAVFLFPLATVYAAPPSNAAVAEEASEHPRISAAIQELESAIAYMEEAPHNFGGHKAAAIAASKKAVMQLRKALAYNRAKVEHK